MVCRKRCERVVLSHQRRISLMRNDVPWEELAQRYRAGMGSTALAIEYGLGDGTVLYRLRKMGVPIRGHGSKMYPKADEATRAKWREYQRKHRAKIKADPARAELHRRMRRLKQGAG